MQRNRPRKRDYLLRIHAVSAVIHVLIIVILCLTIMVYSSRGRKASVLSSNYLTASEINQHFAYKFNDLWKLYRPFFASGGRSDGVLSAYREFAATDGSIQPFVRSKLTTSLRDIMAMDSDISAVSLYRSIEPDALYVLSNKEGVLKDVSMRYAGAAERAILESAQGEGIRILKSGYFDEGEGKYCYLSGGSLPSGTNGSLIVSYSTESMLNLYRRIQHDILPRILILTRSGEVLFDSGETLYGRKLDHPQDYVTIDSCEYKVQAVRGGRSVFVTYALTSVSELRRYAQKDAPLIWAACLLLACVSTGLYILTWLRSSKRVRKINEGIRTIGRSCLNFRFDFPGSQREDEFTSIERAINSMTEDIQRYLDAFKRESKQRIQAEMNEMQAKFNSHFLFNTLETLRAKLDEAGDDENAEFLRTLAYALQSCIKGKRFVTIQEEIALLNIYIDFYRLRYEDAFNVVFDVDPAVSSYGVLRNILQPVVENYFVHGFDREREDNELIITGHMNRDGFIVITLENNGSQIPADRLREIRAQLEGGDEKAGLGLRNVSTRLRLFYGKESCLEIDSSPGRTRTRILMRPMTLEEHEKIMDDLTTA